MATKEVCDGCGTESPDKDMLYKGNNWLEVTVKDRSDFDTYVKVRHKFLLCRECLQIEKGRTYHERKYWARLFAWLGGRLGRAN